MRAHLIWMSLYSFVTLSSQDPSIVYPYKFKAESNPIIKYMRTADPSAHVWPDGKLWLYPSHDPDNAGNNYDGMDGYHVYSTEDLVNWTDHGEVLHSRDIAWNGTGSMWAPDCAYKNGKYYLYFPSKINSTSFRTGVAVGDSPYGPFKANPDFIQGTTGIDPMCFIDDDGQAYLYFGYTGNPFVAKLKDNMVELAEPMRKIDIGTSADAYIEGSWMHKYNGKYYLSWSNYKGWEWNGKKYGALYAVGDSPYGPFTYMGGIKGNPPRAQDHHSIVEFHGQWYIFYHTGNYNGGNSWKRNVCVDYLYHNPDGTIKQVADYNAVSVKIDSVSLVKGNMVPGTIKAADYYKQIGTSKQGSSVGSIKNNSQLEYVIDVLGPDPYDISLYYNTIINNGNVEIYVDNSLKATAQINENNVKKQVQLFKGRHLLKLVFKSADAGEIIKLDSISVKSGYEYFKIVPNAGTGGTIDPAEVRYYKESTDATYKIRGNSGYRIKEVLIDGVSKGTLSDYSFESIKKDHNISATFESCDANLTIYATVGKNTSEDVQKVTAEYGETITISTNTDSGIFLWDGPSFTSNANKVSLTADMAHIGKYKLTYINPEGCTLTKEINVEVVLTAVQAESFSSMNGIKKENCLDVLGGEQVGYINNNDWAIYNINIEQNALYDLSYRVASPAGTNYIDFYSNDKLILSSKLPSTGDFGKWTTFHAGKIPLEKGQKAIKLIFRGSSGYLFNLNWFKLDFAEAILDTLDYPSVKIIEPTVKSNFLEGDSIPISIYANDQNGSIQKVELFINNELKKTFFQKPYKYVINSAEKGEQIIEVFATDNDNKTNKAAFTVNVKSFSTAYQLFQAENFDKSSNGLKIDSYCNTHVGGIDGGEWLCFRGLDFGQSVGLLKLYATAGYDRPGSKVEFRLDSPDGYKIGELEISNTGGWCNYKLFSTEINSKGMHDLYLVFVGTSDIFDLDWFAIDQTNSVNDLGYNNSYLSIFPNPASSVINVRCDIPGEKTLTIYSIEGKEILNIPMDGYLQKISVESLRKGLYIALVKTSEDILSTRFIIK